MEIFLASDVIYSQRVVPLIQQTLAANGIHGLTTAPSRFLPNVGWLEPTTVLSRITGQARAAPGQRYAPGTHGSALIGVSVGDEHAAARTDAQPHQRRRQPDVHGDGRRHRRKPARPTSRWTSR